MRVLLSACMIACSLCGCAAEHQTLRSVLQISPDDKLTESMVRTRALERFPVGTSVRDVRAALPPDEPDAAGLGPSPFEPWRVRSAPCAIEIWSEFARSWLPGSVFSRRHILIRIKGC